MLTARQPLQLISVFDCKTASASSVGLSEVLRALDQLLKVALGRFDRAVGAEATGDPYRGLHIASADVLKLLAEDAAGPLMKDDNGEAWSSLAKALAHSPVFSELAGLFDLSARQLSLVVIAAAPDIDLRYERIYAYLQDDVTRKRPTVDLALNLLSNSTSDQYDLRQEFAFDSALIRSGILQFDAEAGHASLLARSVRVDSQVLHHLLGQYRVDDRLGTCSELIEPTVELHDLAMAPEPRKALAGLAREWRSSGRSLHLYFQGRRGSGKKAAAEALARIAGKRLLLVDLRKVSAPGVNSESILRSALLAARLTNAVAYFGPVDVLKSTEGELILASLLQRISQDPGVVILAGQRTDLIDQKGFDAILTVAFAELNFDQRIDVWRSSLGELTLDSDDTIVNLLAARFKLGPGQIRAATRSAVQMARWRQARDPAESLAPTDAELTAAARGQCGQGLAALAQKVTAKYTWADLVLPADAMAQLHEIGNWVCHREKVHVEWGFARKLSLGKGMAVLFSGPPGTGKTMAAEVIANDLGLDLYKIDLSQIVSKYIGETEKNLDRVFTAAASANAILFFDEADALFGKRSEVKDAHDRYANIEVGYLLQKMEEYEGVAILASNLRSHMDDAFVRRLQFIVDFPFPDEEGRRRIWALSFPDLSRLADDVELDALARNVRLAGGHIRNIALAAAFLAAAEDQPISWRHLLTSSRREHQKMGRSWSVGDLDGRAVVEKS